MILEIRRKMSWLTRNCIRLYPSKHVFCRLLLIVIFIITIQIIFLKSFRTSDSIEDYIEDIQNRKKPIPVFWKHPRCGCLREVPRPHSPFQKVASSCNQFSDLRGRHQKVLSYSFYGDTKSGYFKGVSENVESITQLYPDWVVRLYHDIPPDNKIGSEDLCSVVCKYSNLDDCYVTALEDQFPNLSSKFGMLWRFVVLGDPTVDIFGSRDLDSPVYQREVDSVNDWLKRNKTWHIMRDNPVHTTSMLGGMWGARNDHDLERMQELRKKILDAGKHKYKAYDQLLLNKIIWPVAEKNMAAYDSFLCNSYPGSIPWPTQRVGRVFVGDMYGLSITKECPVDCRPAEHKDWTYC